MHLHAFVFERGDEPLVLARYEREIRRLLAFPVPTAVRIDKSPRGRIPGARLDLFSSSRPGLRTSTSGGCLPRRLSPRVLAPHTLQLGGILKEAGSATGGQSIW